MGEQKAGQVDDLKDHLVAVRGLLTPFVEQTGIIDQDVYLRVSFTDRQGGFAHLCQALKIRDEKLAFRAEVAGEFFLHGRALFQDCGRPGRGCAPPRAKRRAVR